MPKYAVKVGEIHVRSDRPIEPEARKAVMRELRRHFARGVIMDAEDLEVVLTVDRH